MNNNSNTAIGRSDNELRAATIHVAYEIKMFREAWKRLDSHSPSLGYNNSAVLIPLAPPANIPTPLFTSNNSTPTPQIPDDSLLGVEALLVHFRNLMEFFYTPYPNKDDLVLAQHYTGGAPPQKRPTWVTTSNRRCGELLAHLTYRRSVYLNNNQHHWNGLPELVEKMEEQITAFLDSLTPERKAWFE